MAESRDLKRNTYTIYDDNTVGTVQIADEVVAIIAGLAATEVEEIVDAQWKDLGMPETLWHCRVKEFGPLIVSIDTEGRNLFEENKVIFNERKEKVYEEICKHVKFIK